MENIDSNINLGESYALETSELLGQVVYLPANNWPAMVKHLKRVSQDKSSCRPVSKEHEHAFRMSKIASRVANIGNWALGIVVAGLGVATAVTGSYAVSAAGANALMVDLSSSTSGSEGVVAFVGAGILNHIASNRGNIAQNKLALAKIDYENLAGALLRLSFVPDESAHSVCAEAKELDLDGIQIAAEDYLTADDARDLLDPLRQAVTYLKDASKMPHSAVLANTVALGLQQRP